MSTEVAAVIRKALSRFGPNGENWVQGKAALSEPKCCVTTAFFRIGPEPDWRLMEDATNILASVLALRPVLETWNDHVGRTFPEVKALFDAAIAKAEASQ